MLIGCSSHTTPILLVLDSFSSHYNSQRWSYRQYGDHKMLSYLKYWKSDSQFGMNLLIICFVHPKHSCHQDSIQFRLDRDHALVLALD